MKMRHSLLALVAVGLLNFGCSSSSDDDSEGTKTPAEVPAGGATPPAGAAGTSDETWSKDFAGNTGKGFIDGMMGGLSGKTVATDMKDKGNAGGDATGLTLRTEEECKPTTVSGSEADADADGIPDDLVQTYDCNTTKEGATTKVTGGLGSKDKNPASKAGGYTYEITNFAYSVEADMEGIKFTTKGTIASKFDVTVEGSTFTAKEKSTITSESTGILGSGAIKTSSNTDTTVVYVADEDGNDDPFDKGTIKSVDGTINTKSEGTAAFDITVGIKAENLVKGTCESGFTSGTISFIDGSGNATTATFKDCAATWTRNGAAITPTASIAG